MSTDDKNRRLHSLRGLEPRITGWMASGDKGESGCMFADDKRNVEEWLAALPEGAWPKSYEVLPCTEVPRYDKDLNAVYEVVKSLTEPQRQLYREHLCRQLHIYLALDADAETRVDALILTLEEK